MSPETFDAAARRLLKAATYDDLWCLLVACKILKARMEKESLNEAN